MQGTLYIFMYACMYECMLLCCSTPRSETHLPPRCSRASVYRSTCAWWRWADYQVQWNDKVRWAPTLVSARATRCNKGRSSAQHADHLTQNRRCLPSTRVAFERLAMTVWQGISWVACKVCDTGSVYNTSYAPSRWSKPRLNENVTKKTEN